MEKEITIEIERLVYGGTGLSHHESTPVFVSDVLPGEKVVAGDLRKRAGCLFARPNKIIQSSPDRREPFCPYAKSCESRCGGCDWQHINYNRQVSLKQEIFIDCLKRIGKINLDLPIEIFTSPEEEYRHRAQFHIDHSHRTIGFTQRDSNTIVSIDHCPLLTKPLAAFLGNLQSHAAAMPSGCSQIKAISGASGDVASSPIIPSLSELFSMIKTDSFHFKIAGDSFFQQNVFLLHALGSWAQDKITGNRFVDLYGGVGFFSIYLGKQFSQGLLIEESESQVRLARENFTLNNLQHVEASACSVESFSAGKNQSIQPDDCVIVDPPRTGLAPFVCKQLGKISPVCIIYLSCNPSTQARDLNHLVNSCGYRITHTAMFDLYPQTSHLETGIILTR